MGDNSKIEWTDATVNFWWGCTKVGPGCDHCYAETWSKRTGHSIWGPGAPRRKINGAQTALNKLNRRGGLWVFIQSMSDILDNEVPLPWFRESWEGICAATNCRVQIVTKRLSMLTKRLDAIGYKGWPQHVGLIVTVVNQEEADRDVPRLLAMKAKLGIPWVGLSMEPLLGPVVLRPEWLPTLDWVIVGGESGPGARPMHPDWARGLRDQCVSAGVPFFFKQWGEWAPSTPEAAEGNPRSGWQCLAGHPHIARAAELYPEAGAAFIEHKGKKAAGRMLDGRTWDQMPGVADG